MNNTDRINLLPYASNRVMAQAWVESGRIFWAERSKRTGLVRVSLNGGRRLNVHDAMRQIDAWYAARQISVEG